MGPRITGRIVADPIVVPATLFPSEGVNFSAVEVATDSMAPSTATEVAEAFAKVANWQGDVARGVLPLLAGAVHQYRVATLSGDVVFGKKKDAGHRLLLDDMTAPSLETLNALMQHPFVRREGHLPSTDVSEIFRQYSSAQESLTGVVGELAKGEEYSAAARLQMMIAMYQLTFSSFLLDTSNVQLSLQLVADLISRAQEKQHPELNARLAICKAYLYYFVGGDERSLRSALDELRPVPHYYEVENVFPELHTEYRVLTGHILSDNPTLGTRRHSAAFEILVGLEESNPFLRILQLRGLVSITNKDETVSQIHRQKLVQAYLDMPTNVSDPLDELRFRMIGFEKGDPNLRRDLISFINKPVGDPIGEFAPLIERLSNDLRLDVREMLMNLDMRIYQVLQKVYGLDKEEFICLQEQLFAMATMGL